MPGQFLHGVEVIEVESGPRPIRSAKSSVIGIVGTAPYADTDKFPLNTPVLISRPMEVNALTDSAPDGTTDFGTLPISLDAIYRQAGAIIVVVRVDAAADANEQRQNIIGGTTVSAYAGVHALLAAEGSVHATPRIIIAPGFSNDQIVLNELILIAERLRAFVYADGPNTDNDQAITYRQQFDSRRVRITDPAIKTFDARSGTEIVLGTSAFEAGVRARLDNEQGFWNSISNQTINGVLGTARMVDYQPGDINSEANRLNENEVSTIIHQQGYRTWGNRTTSSDPKWAFENVVRTSDIIRDSIQRGVQWAVDRNLNKTFFEDVTESVNAYLRTLVSLGAILGGKCWPDPELNTPDQLQAGKAYFNYDYTVPAPAEHIGFKALNVTDYYEAIVSQAS